MVDEAQRADRLVKKDAKGCRRWAWGCVVVPLICGFAGYLNLRPQPLLSRLSGEERKIVESPDRLEIIRIKPLENPYFLEKPGGILANTERLLPPVVADKALRDETVRAFQNASSQFFSPMCEPEPGVAFRFTRNGKTLESSFCASCGAIFFYRTGEKSTPTAYIDKAPFMNVARKSFPKDEALARGTE